MNRFSSILVGAVFCVSSCAALASGTGATSSVAVAAATSTPVALTSNNVGYVDVQKILAAAPQVKKMEQALQKQFAGKKEEIVKLDATLRTDLKNYQRDLSVLSKKDAAALKAKIDGEETKLRQAEEAFNQQYYNQRNQVLGGLMQGLQAAVGSIAKSKGMLLVLPSNTLAYADPSLDITNQVLASWTASAK